MPIYVYEVVTDSEEGGERFEILQKITDRPLKRHPETGQPVRRMPTAPNVRKGYHPQSTEKSLSDKNLDRLGFTKYVKQKDGGYEKRVGSGPDTLDGYK